MPQKDLLLPWRRALENAVLGATIGGEAKGRARERALALFERFGLSGFERAWPGQLSGGMRQRLALLRTFLMPNDVLLLDEPFGALDAITRREMYLWLEEVWRRDGRTGLFVTHDVEEALLLSHRVYVMSRRPGRIVDTVDVPFPRPRTTDAMGSPEFAALKAGLLDALGIGSTPQRGGTLPA
jgi:ABC-type nitrate/sulfonate/bicarbonate transport system ATPase subunit